ncbi:MAG: restriction endonuclease subunit S [Solirubrobacteraceae bacterium]
MSSDWIELTLGRSCSKIGSGATPRGGANAYVENGVAVLIRSQNVHNGRFMRAGLVGISEADADKLTGAAALPGDVLLNITGDSVARGCMAPGNLGEARVSQHVAILRARREVLIPAYLMYWLVSPSTQHYLLQLASAGATRNALTKGMLEGLILRAPDVAKQKEIVEILGALDSKIDSNDRLAVTLEQVGLTEFSRRFGDLTPDGGDTSEGSLQAGVLGDLVDVCMGQSPPGSSYTPDHEVGLLLVQGNGGFGVRYPAADVYTTHPSKVAFAGDTLMTVRAPVGAVNVAHSELCIGRGVAALRSPFPAFTEFLVRSLEPRWSSEESGTIFGAVNRDQIAGLPVGIPEEKEVADFEAFARPLIEKLFALHVESARWTRLRDALLPGIMRGTIDVLS